MAKTTAAEAALRQEGARVAWFKERISAALDRGDHAEVERLGALLDRVTDGIEARVGRAVKEVSMSKEHEDNYQKAVSQLTDGVIAAAAELRKLDAEREKYPASWYAIERARIVRFIRGSDGAARDALAFYRRQALDEASALRVQAEADRPANERLADMTELRMLSEGKLDGGAILAQAEAALAAGRPQRASLLAEAARAKGARFTHDLTRDIEEALDREDKTRALARGVEDSVSENIAKFEDLRFRSLTASGLGVNESGEVGTGTADVARANVARKMAAFASGGDFSDAAPEGGDA